MGGKWPIFAVLGLGLVAALCATILMAAMKAGAGGPEAAPTTTPVLVAKADLAAMTHLEQEMVEIREVERGTAPDGAFGDPVQVLGRVLKTPLVAGQPILKQGLLSDEDGAKLASSLPEGLRAVSLELPGSSAMRGLLYPGCRVDVLVAYKRIPGRMLDSAPASRTLLQNVSVLAVEDKTVFTSDDPDKEEGQPRPVRRNDRSLMVTLMLDPQQARELQAARDLGELALSLRNPLDASLTADPEAPTPLEEVPVAVAEEEVEEGPWEVRVIRGDKSETVTLNKPEEPVQRFADVPTEPPLEIDE